MGSGFLHFLQVRSVVDAVATGPYWPTWTIKGHCSSVELSGMASVSCIYAIPFSSFGNVAGMTEELVF